MPRVVPSDVVKAIDRLFPWAATQEEGKDANLHIGNAEQLMGLLDLVDRLPEELLSVGGDRYTEFSVSVAATRTKVEEWHARGDTGRFVRVPGLPHLSPVTLIRRYLAACPDQAPAAGTTVLSFIQDSALRESIRLDMSSATNDLAQGEWKGATVLAGSAIEALLLWVLQDYEKRNPGGLSPVVSGLLATRTLTRNPGPDPEAWGLHEYVEVATYLKLIEDDTAKLVRLAKDFRNLIHPGRAARLGQNCDRSTALTALAAVEAVARDLV